MHWNVYLVQTNVHVLQRMMLSEFGSKSFSYRRFILKSASLVDQCSEEERALSSGDLTAKLLVQCVSTRLLTEFVDSYRDQWT